MIDWNQIGDEAGAILGRYLKIESINPPGNEVETASFLAALLAERGIECTRFESGARRVNLLARLPGDGRARPLVLLHHMDVVAADESRWKRKPFSGEVDDGYVYGRGAIDMKGMGVMQLLALDLLRRETTPRSRDVIYLAVADEEEGSAFGTQWMLKQGIPELDAAEFVWDEGGFGMQDIFGPRPVFCIAVAEKQALWLRLVARGEPGHAGIPSGPNAADLLVAAIGRLARHRFPLKIGPVVQEMFRGIAGIMSFPASYLLRHLRSPLATALARRALTADPTVEAMLRTTLGLSMLSAGTKVNVVPERAEAVFDARLLPGEDPGEFVALLAKIVDDERVPIEVIQNPEPSRVSSTRSALYRAIAGAARRLVPESIVVPMQTPGSTDSCFFRRRGVEACGLFPAIITPAEFAGFHGHDERISIDNLRLGTRMVYEVLKEMVET